MTNKELIEALQQLPPDHDAMVFVELDGRYTEAYVEGASVGYSILDFEEDNPMVVIRLKD